MHTLIDIIGIFGGAAVSFGGGVFCATGADRVASKEDGGKKLFLVGLSLFLVSSFGVFVFGRLS